MGCCQSHEGPYDPPPRPVRFSQEYRDTPVNNMGYPSQDGPPFSPLGSSANLSTQHERLILELLPFKDARQFQEWLAGPYVRGAWSEFCRDFLSHEPGAPEPDKQRVAQVAKDAINGKNPKFMVYHPQKDGWTVEDHTVRFIITVVADNMLKSMWSDSDWKKRGIEITKAVYEVLSFIRSTAVRTDGPTSISTCPPRYEG